MRVLSESARADVSIEDSGLAGKDLSDGITPGESDPYSRSLSNPFRLILLRTLFSLSHATARSKPCVFSRLRTLCRHNGRVGGYDPVENSHVSPANYQLSTVDFPAIPLAAMSGFPVPHQLSRLQRRA